MWTFLFALLPPQPLQPQDPPCAGGNCVQGPAIDSGFLCTGQPLCPYLLPSWSVLLPQFLHTASWHNTQHFSQGAHDLRKETSFPCSAWLNSAFSFLVAISTPVHQSQVDMVICVLSLLSPVSCPGTFPCPMLLLEAADGL